MAFSFAFLAGIFASSGSFFGKLSGEKLFINEWMCLLTQIACFAAMVGFNAIMWTYYMKAMQKMSSLQATVISCATNYVISSILGVGIFGEVTGLLFWCGISCLLLGLFLMQSPEIKEKSP